MLPLLICSFVSCAAWSEFSPERLDKIHEEDKKWSDWLNKYIKSVLYVGMPEDEFIRLFTKDISWNDQARPYIINHKGDRYLIVGLNNVRYRVTFKSSLLIKLEEYGWEKIPILTANYRDVSHFLKGYQKNGPGFYDAMPEEEFLEAFSNSILSCSKNQYVVIGKNGIKYRVTFTKGFLSGWEGLGKVKSKK